MTKPMSCPGRCSQCSLRGVSEALCLGFSGSWASQVGPPAFWDPDNADNGGGGGSFQDNGCKRMSTRKFIFNLKPNWNIHSSEPSQNSDFSFWVCGGLLEGK